MSQGVKTTPTHTPNNTGIEHMHAYAEDTQTRRHIEKTDALLQVSAKASTFGGEIRKAPI